MNATIPQLDIKVIIGLGNPGPAYYNTRHSIGFQIVDTLADMYQGVWIEKEKFEHSSIRLNNKNIILIKPMTYMNNSGEVAPWLKKQGINAENILVVHDELDLPFGNCKFKFDGSARGHNGLKSIISYIGHNFLRLRFGVDRPSDKSEVSNYVLKPFFESQDQLSDAINQAVEIIATYIQKEAE